MLKIVLIRHGKTQGNLERRYIGWTDESLLPEEKLRLKSKPYPKADVVYVSGLKRTQETAKLIYPHLVPIVSTNFNETNFGIFENLTYNQLQSNPHYQKWIDLQGNYPIPQGESAVDFKSRCIKEFKQLIHGHQNQEITIALVVHGGTIMAILEEFAIPQKSFYHWQVKNGEGYQGVVTEKGQIEQLERLYL